MPKGAEAPCTGSVIKLYDFVRKRANTGQVSRMRHIIKLSIAQCRGVGKVLVGEWENNAFDKLHVDR